MKNVKHDPICNEHGCVDVCPVFRAKADSGAYSVYLVAVKAKRK